MRSLFQVIFFLQVGKSYTELRKEREEFRRKLVQLILCEDGPSSEKQDDGTPFALPSREERVVLRYYYYIQQGVDTVHVTHLDCDTLKRILQLVPPKLRRWKDHVRTLICEVKVNVTLHFKDFHLLQLLMINYLL